MKGYQYGYHMKGLDLGVKNLVFVYRLLCLFTFYEYKQLNVNKSQFNCLAKISGTAHLGRTQTLPALYLLEIALTYPTLTSC